MTKRARLTDDTVVLSLNINISMQLGLQWSMDHAIRELLLNCVDQDPDTTLREEKDGRWIFENKGVLEIENFTYSTTQAQVEDRTNNGNFGYGLKDAIAVLTCLGVQYEATSNGTSFSAFKDDKGDLFVTVKKDNASENCGTVQQLLTFHSATELQQAVEAAKKQVLQFREDIMKCPHFQICSSKDGKVSGMVYLTTNASGSSELFVQNCAYPFVIDDRTKPLVFTYNLFVDKAGWRGKDRAGLPENWLDSLTNLIRDSPAEVFDALLEARARDANFFEFGIEKISTDLNVQAEQKRIEAEHAEKQYRYAVKKLDELRAELQEARENAAVPDLPTAVQAEYAAHVKTIQNLIEKHLEIVARFGPAPKPQVLVFRGSVPPPRDDVAFVTISHPRGKLWQENKIPTLEEYDLMRASSIPLEHLSKVRALHRLLSVMRIATLQIKSAATSAPPVTAQWPTLLINFDLPEEELVSAAIQTLFFSPSYFKPAKGMTHEQALARFASSLLRFAPENPAEISHCQLEAEDFSFKVLARKNIPTLEEYKLMQSSSIPLKHLSKVRALHRLLCLMGISNLQMKSAAPSAPSVTVQRPALLVNFDLPEEELVSAAIQTLCSPSYFKPAKGMTHEQALARFGSSLLRFAPENPAEISRCQIYGEAFSFDPPPVMTGPKPFCPLLVDTAWNTKAGGISAFNIQLAEGLAKCKCTVYVAVTDSVEEATTLETQATWEDAKKNGVIIVPLSQTRGNFTPELSASEAASITHIIGHAHITGKAAAQMHKLPQLSHTRLWQFNHVLPREADQLKDYGTPVDKSNEIIALNRAADFVWSVGQTIFDEFDREFRKEGQQGKHKQIILPLNPRFIQSHPRKSFGSTVNVLFFGRTEDGMDIAQRACEYANNHNTTKMLKKKVHLTVRGLVPDTSVDALLKLLALQDVEFPDIFIMPSRLEPFGLAATEAIAAGVPVLVSNNSGVARLLAKERYPELCVKTSKYHPDLKKDDIKSDAEAWGEAIVRLVIQGEATFQLASKLKTDLLQAIKEPYTDFIEVGSRIAN